jgi:hypothetical protein
MDDYRRGFNDALSLVIDEMQFRSDEMRAGQLSLGPNTNPFDVGVNIATMLRRERYISSTKDFRQYRKGNLSFFDKQRNEWTKAEMR